MERLVAFGCSNTFGHGLSDCWHPTTNGPGPNPSKFAWPQLLADKMNKECVNLSECGSSNLKILHTILNFQYEPTDLIMVMWSHDNRDVIFTSPTTYVPLGSWMTHDLIKPFTELHNPYNSSVRSWMYIHHAYLFLQAKKLKFHFIAHYAPSKEFLTYKSEYTSEIKFKKLTAGLFRNKYPKALDNGHMGEEGHREFANSLYAEISTD